MDGLIIIALGANLSSPAGPPEVTLAKAIGELDGPGVRVTAVSRFYRTAPVPASDQPDFINAAALLETALGPRGLLTRLHEVERNLGRRRVQKWEARVLDLDLIAYGDRVVPENWPECGQKNRDSGDIIVPHPRLQDRAFVLVPMNDIAAGWRHPVTRENASEMLARLDDAGSPQPLDFPPPRS